MCDYSPIALPKLAFAPCESEAHVAVAHSLTLASFLTSSLTSSDHALASSCDISLQLSDVEGGVEICVVLAWFFISSYVVYLHLYDYRCYFQFREC